MDRGFDFLGMRIQRRSRAGKTPCAYTFMSKSMLAATKRKVKTLTRRHTLNLSLSELLMAINPVLRGVANYVRYAAVKRTLHYLAYYTWWRVMRWLRAKHPGRNWTWFRRHYFGTDGLNEAGVTLFSPTDSRDTCKRAKSPRRGTPGNCEPNKPPFAESTTSEADWSDSSSAITAEYAPPTPAESPVLGNGRRVRRAGRGMTAEDQHRTSSRPYSAMPYGFRPGAGRIRGGRGASFRGPPMSGSWKVTSKPVYKSRIRL